jgi:hypothetical protein
VSRCFDLGCAGCEECCDDKDECRPMSAEQYWCVKCHETRSQGCFAKGCPGLPHRSALAAGDLMAIAEEAGAARLGENVVQCTREDLAQMFAKTSPASLTEREQYIWTLGYAAGAGRSSGETHASGSLPPLPEPCNKGQSLVGGIDKPWEPLFNRHQMYEYARQSVHLVDENLLGFAQWLLDAYRGDEGMPEPKEIARRAREAINPLTR